MRGLIATPAPRPFRVVRGMMPKKGRLPCYIPRVIGPSPSKLRRNCFLVMKLRGCASPRMPRFFLRFSPLGVQSRIVDDGVVLPYRLIGGETLTATRSLPFLSAFP